MLCPFCGFNIPENNPKFCPSCGKTIIIDEQKTQYIPHNHPINTPPVQQTPPPVQQTPPPVQQVVAPVQPTYPAPPVKENKSSKGIIIAVLAAVLVSAIVLIVLFITGVISPGGKDDKPDTTEAAAIEQSTKEAPTEEASTEEASTEEITSEDKKEPMDSVTMAAYLKERTVTVHTDVGTGTGFYIDSKGTLVTCYHVIENSTEIQIESASGEFYNVEKILGFDWNLDIAVLKIENKNSLYLELPEESVKTGEKVYALGSSLGEYQASFSDGVVASDSRIFSGVDCIQFTAAISPGNSGGPLVNEYGEILGINAFKRTDGENINFAVKIGYIDSLDMTLDLTVSEFVREIQKENEKSYYFYDYSEGCFYPSLINTYQEITGCECTLSLYEWSADATCEGYDPEMGIFEYEYDADAFEEYIDYITAHGFTTYEEDYGDGFTEYYYVNERFGMAFEITIFDDDPYVYIEPFMLA